MAYLQMWLAGNIDESIVLDKIGIKDTTKRDRYIKKLFHLLKEGEENARKNEIRPEEIKNSEEGTTESDRDETRPQN